MGEEYPWWQTLIMRKVLILVEGQTEERFIKDVLEPHLSSAGVYPVPKLATTKRVKHGADFKGGITDFGKVKDDLRRLLGDTDAALITTMIDYYGLPNDFPGKRSLQGQNSRERVRELEAALEEHLNAGPRFLAYFMIHEFEALLFSDPKVLAEVMNLPETRTRLQDIRNGFPTPEDINDDPHTRPSSSCAHTLSRLS
ncbi:MAG: DUF4276 family protein [Candidatus Methylomirabilis sp.]|nr:DUF4276 family protein [Candidatus Methylomirabilis sp.]